MLTNNGRLHVTACTHCTNTYCNIIASRWTKNRPLHTHLFWTCIYRMHQLCICQRAMCMFLELNIPCWITRVWDIFPYNYTKCEESAMISQQTTQVKMFYDVQIRRLKVIPKASFCVWCLLWVFFFGCGSRHCCVLYFLPNVRFLTDCVTFGSCICWHLVKSILPSFYTNFPMPPAFHTSNKQICTFIWDLSCSFKICLGYFYSCP